MGMPERVTAEEIRQVQPRVGTTLKARLQWALDFVRKDLASLTVGDWANLQREFLAFRVFLIRPDALDPTSLKLALADHIAIPRRRRGMLARGAEHGRGTSEAGREPRTHLPSRRELQWVQRQWRAIIVPLLERGSELHGIGPFHVYVDVERWDLFGQSVIDLRPIHDPTARLQLLSLLGFYAHLVHECPEVSCRRWFVAMRKGQKFCNRTCQNRAAIRAHRAAARRPSKRRHPGRSPGSGKGRA
jgi:hypothetical protein